MKAEDRLKELIKNNEISSLDAAKQEGFIMGWNEALRLYAIIEKSVSISYLAEKAKEEEKMNREKMLENYNTPLDKIKPYENKHFLALVDSILKELNEH